MRTVPRVVMTTHTMSHGYLDGRCAVWSAVAWIIIIISVHKDRNMECKEVFKWMVERGIGLRVMEIGIAGLKVGDTGTVGRKRLAQGVGFQS